MQTLDAARATLEMNGDLANAAHAGYLEARRLLLIGHLDEAERSLATLDVVALPQPSRTGYWLVMAGIAIRRIRAGSARAALERARQTAGRTGIPALTAEVERAAHALESPAAQLIARGESRLIKLAEVEELLASDALVIDACRHVVRCGRTMFPLTARPVLFALARALAEAWCEDIPRETLIARAFRGRDADASHRARLRVEIGRLRKTLTPLAAVNATSRGFQLRPHGLTWSLSSHRLSKATMPTSWPCLPMARRGRAPRSHWRSPPAPALRSAR